MKALLVALLALPTLALAAPPPKPPGPPADMEARHKMGAQRMRMMFIVGLSEALELNEAEALKMSEKSRSFEERRRSLHRAMFESMQTLKKAAEGDKSALGGVDQATQKILDTRLRMAELDRDLFNELAKGLSGERKAKLALFLAHFQRQGHGMGKGMGGPGMGMGPCGGMGTGPCMGPPREGKGMPGGMGDQE